MVLSLPAGFTPDKANVFINDRLIGSFSKKPFTFSFIPEDVRSIEEDNEIKVIVYDEEGDKTTLTSEFNIEE